MARLISFLTISFALIGVFIYLEGLLPDGDPFARKGERTSVFNQTCSATTLCELKLRHARSVPRYDIGIFGNSRSVEIGAEHAGIRHGRFFNFSVPGESVRHVVSFLEQLERHGKAPHVAVISVDHCELQYYGNPSGSPCVVRWQTALKDIWAGLTSPQIPLSSLVRMGWRHLYNETHLFKRNFEVAFVVNGAVNFFALNSFPGKDWRVDKVGFRQDGSRYSSHLNNPSGEVPILPLHPSSVMAAYLVYDLERLKSLADRGIRVVLYESPLEPKSADHYAGSPSSHGKRTRDILEKHCERLGLPFIAAPKRLPGINEPWTSADHAPPGQLGPYVRHLIDQFRAESRHDI